MTLLVVRVVGAHGDGWRVDSARWSTRPEGRLRIKGMGNSLRLEEMMPVIYLLPHDLRK
jgi:hypothetical protein